jgi:hypothetical protein
MRITDFEGGRSLNDVAIQLSPEEATELAAYLDRLIHSTKVKTAHLTEVTGTHLTREITIHIEPQGRAACSP